MSYELRPETRPVRREAQPGNELKTKNYKLRTLERRNSGTHNS